MESFDEILKDIATSNELWDSSREEISYTESKYTLMDKDFFSFAKCFVINEKFASSVQTIVITTAWSEFSYKITTCADGVFVTYEGAYRGLLSQNLLPKLTPVDLMSAKVKSSLNNYDTLSEYVVVQEKLHSFKKEEGFQVNVHVHPRCVHEILTRK